MNEALNKAVSDATVEMFQSVLGKTAQASPATEVAINSRNYEASVVISFVGALSGAFALRCSSKTAAHIASQMLGTEVAEGSDDMKDAVGEFLNMIVGTAKTRFPSKSEPFKISVPTTVVGTNYVLHVKASDSEKLSLLDFRCEEDTLSIEVHLK